MTTEEWFKEMLEKYEYDPEFIQETFILNQEEYFYVATRYPSLPAGD